MTPSLMSGSQNGCCRHPTGAEAETRGEPVGSCTMTNEEKDPLIAYLVDSGELGPDGDVGKPSPGLVPGPRGRGT